MCLITVALPELGVWLVLGRKVVVAVDMAGGSCGAPAKSLKCAQAVDADLLLVVKVYLVAVGVALRPVLQ